MPEDDPNTLNAALAATDDAESIDSALRMIAAEPAIPLESDGRHEAWDAQASRPPMMLPRLGDVVGERYRIEAMLGAGGMGAVFSARHVKTGREVAIKVLLPRHGSSGFSSERIARFVREAQAAGRIRHPNVVDVYDVDVSDHTPYLVMERLHGESLWQRIKRGPLSPDDAVPILLAAMEGVAEAHRQGVIHRDLKPDNIFLVESKHGAPPVPKVLDFGVSRIITRDDAIDPDPTALTRTGNVLGTPAYMPLEQLRGETTLDVRADVYALGVILYEALCGKRPHDASSDHELIVKMATEPALDISRRVPSLDTALSRVVMKAIAREPSDRFSNVPEFAEALSDVLNGRAHAFESPDPRAVDVADRAAEATESAASSSAMSRTARWPWGLGLVLVGIGAALALMLAADDAPTPKAQVAPPKAAHESPLSPPEAQAPNAPPPPVDGAETPAPPSAPTKPVVPPQRTLRRNTRSPLRATPPSTPTPEASDPATDVRLDDF